MHDDLLTPQKAQETRLRRPCYWKMLVHSPLHIRHIRPSFPGQTSCFFFCGLKAKRQGFFLLLDFQIPMTEARSRGIESQTRAARATSRGVEI